MPLDPFSPQERLPLRASREYFTDRVDFIETFHNYVRASDEETLRVLVFHGVGGIGKSTLLQKLDGDLNTHFPDVPHARFNLEDSEGPAQAYRKTLLRWRSDLERDFHIEFPRFDICLSVMLANEGGKAPDIVQMNSHLNSAFQFFTSVASMPLAGVGKAIDTEARKHPRLEALLRKAGGTEDVIALRERAEQNDRTLPDELLRRFMRDLAEHLQKRRPGKCCRAVLFLDTYEALWAGRDKDQTANALHLDDWARTLASYCLHPNLRILLVIGGRDLLQWRDDPDTQTRWETDKLLDSHLMGGLPAGDAQDFLAKCGIGFDQKEPPMPLQQAILRCCNVEHEPQRETACHPLYLALCAEIVLNTRNDPAKNADPPPEFFSDIPGVGVARELADRFLKSLHDKDMSLWVKELALTPRFDEACALDFAARRRHAVGRAAWQMLTGFAFMERETEAEGGFYRMHRTMTESLCELTPDADVTAIHTAFRAHWHSRIVSDTDIYAAFAWYHLWHQDPETARNEWNLLAERERRALRTSIHLRLMDWWTPIGLEARPASTYIETVALNDLGVELQETALGNRAANLSRAIACYEAALRVRREDTLPQQWAETLANLGITLEIIGDVGGARNAWTFAIQGYVATGLEQGVRQMKEWIDTLPKEQDGTSATS